MVLHHHILHFSFWDLISYLSLDSIMGFGVFICGPCGVLVVLVHKFRAVFRRWLFSLWRLCRGCKMSFQLWFMALNLFLSLLFFYGRCLDLILEWLLFNGRHNRRSEFCHHPLLELTQVLTICLFFISYRILLSILEWKFLYRLFVLIKRFLDDL